MINENVLKNKLHSVAREKNIPFNACLKQLHLERFLVRLSRSKHSTKLIFKGGFLLSYLMEIGRETKDLDFLLTQVKAEENTLQEIFNDIITSDVKDGFRFSFNSIEILEHNHMEYPGYRLNLRVSFSKMRDNIQIDIGVGDIVEPMTREISLVGSPFLEQSISLQVYPVETIFAEKLETILTRGTLNSRVKDYHDLILMIRKEGILNLEKLKQTIKSTFSNRGTDFLLIKFNENSLTFLQALWKSHYQGLGDKAHELNLPKDIESVIDEINNHILLV